MPAIGLHHTGTDERAWDGPGNKARLRNDESESYYRKAYAWQDPEGDAETKEAYKFVHHFVGEDGEIGEASTRGCSAGIAVLNGGRGGADIPEGDRQGVYNHLAAHLEDADLEVPELRARPVGQVERRMQAVAEVRVSEGDGQRPRILWYPAVFDELSEEMWGFRERIRPGAFAKTLGEADVRALLNHDPNYILGRNTAGTLRLAEDKRGLRAEVEPPDTQWARDLLVSIKRGDIDQGSFNFQMVRESWTGDEGGSVRDLIEVRLFDVSLVTFPAYPGTAGVEMRGSGIDFWVLAQAVERSRSGEVREGDREVIEGAVGILRGLSAAPGQEPHPAVEAEEAERARARLDVLRRQLEIAEKETPSRVSIPVNLTD